MEYSDNLGRGGICEGTRQTHRLNAYSNEDETAARTNDWVLMHSRSSTIVELQLERGTWRGTPIGAWDMEQNSNWSAGRGAANAVGNSKPEFHGDPALNWR